MAIEDLNVAGMLRRCQVKKDEKSGRFLPNGQSRKKGLNRAISDAAWNELMREDRLSGCVREARAGGISEERSPSKLIPNIPALNAENAVIQMPAIATVKSSSATLVVFTRTLILRQAKTIRDRALEMVRGDWASAIRFSEMSNNAQG
jgi:putative transposase